MMKRFSGILLALSFFWGISSHAGSGSSHFGFNAGVGVPYLTRFGLNFVNGSNRFSAEVSYNFTSLTSGMSDLKLTKPEFMAKWHPFAGAFFLGLGVGRQSLKATATDITTGGSVAAEVTSYTVTPTIGWMYGVVDGGLFVGFDLGYQLPFGAKTTVDTNLPTNNASYADVVNAGDKYGSTAFPVITLLRLGYLF